jgi:hypothetical protein
MAGEDSEDSHLLQRMAVEAENYLSSFAWCQSIESRYFGAGIGGIVGIFFFGIQSRRPDVDEWLWVVVGDLPPAYIVTDDCDTPSEALDAYIGLMESG